MTGCSEECCFGLMYCEWYGVCDCVVLSVVGICADYGGVNVFKFVLTHSTLMGRVFVSSCRCCVFCVCCTPSCYSKCGVLCICSLLMFVSDVRGDHMVETTFCYGFVCCDDRFLLVHPLIHRPAVRSIFWTSNGESVFDRFSHHHRMIMRTSVE